MKTLRYITYLFVFLTLVQNRVQAGVEPAVSTIVDGKYFIDFPGNAAYVRATPFSNGIADFSTAVNPYRFPSYQQIRKIDNMLQLYLDPDTEHFIDFPFTLEVSLDLKKYENGAGAPLSTTTTLTIHFDPKERTKWIEKANFHFVNAGKVDYEVSAVSLTHNGSPLNNQQKELVSQVVGLRSDVIIERYFDFDVNDRLYTADIQHTYDPATNELTIYWTPIKGAELYDLEWAWVDGYDGIGGMINGGSLTAGKQYDLNRNSTRVQLSERTYTFPLVYESGFLTYRVRAIGKKYDAGSDKVYAVPGKWSNGYNNLPNGPEQCPNLDFTDCDHLYTIPLNQSHEKDTKNWQRITSFAEEGKRKDVVSYMDGTLRNRQSITGLSTDRMTLIGESIYDHQGRAAISVMPVPVQDPTLKYYANFNQGTSGAYNRKNFDVTRPSCDLSADPMSTASGASRYYSPSNPDRTEEKAYIPDAEKYPFVQTEFTPDNTGRVRRQSGVGTNHRLGSGHETEYFYGTPAQEELAMLFGVEVGEASHYKKNVSKDPNGQLSVSMIDLKGNVIATALAGTPPKNLDPLDSYQPYPMTIDLLAFNQTDILDNAMVASRSFTVTTESEYRFNYQMSNEQFETALCNGLQICYDCIYDLEITLIDNYSCNDVFYSVKEKVGPFILDREGNLKVDANCDQNKVNFDSRNLPQPFSVRLPVGSYTITKKLKVNEQAVEAYVEHYIQTFEDKCPSIYEEMLAAQLALIDTTDCYLDDDEPNPTPCEIARQGMLFDLNPGGQYGQVDFATMTSSDPLSVFNRSNQLPQSNANWQNPVGGYKNADGTASLVGGLRPEQLSFSDFILNWQASWAEALLPYHPEYCYLEWCGRIDRSYQFDQELMLTNDYNGAQRAGYFSPVSADPYFRTGSSGAAFLGRMNNELSNYNGSTYSMLQVAVMTSLTEAGRPASGTDATNWINTNRPNSSDAIADKVWQTFSAMYLAKKEYFQYLDRTDFAMNQCSNRGGYNECIGADPFDPLRNGFAGGLNSKFLRSQQTCSQRTFALYKNKTKRFPSAYDLPGNYDPYGDPGTVLPQGSTWAKSTMSENCADCFCNADFKALINGALASGAHTGSGFVLLPQPYLSSYLQLQISQFNAGTAGLSGIRFSYVSTGLQIEFVFDDGTTSCPILLDPDQRANPSFNWEAVDSIDCITFDSTATGSQLIGKSNLYLKTGQSIPVDVILSTNCPLLEACSFTPTPNSDSLVCIPDSFAITYDSMGVMVTRMPPADICDPCTPWTDSIPSIPIPNNCVEEQILAAYASAYTQYQRYLDSLRQDIRTAYIRHCLNVAEKFNVSYTDDLHHFTLYYYDQATNLLKTVPPAGVDRLTPSQVSQAITYMRTGSGTPITPNHQKVSDYTYNSLNQLRKQRIPDHDGESEFHYDELSRIVASQNAEQKQFNRCSYSLYDELGRIYEAGELTGVRSIPNTRTMSAADFRNWVNGYRKQEITRSVYDEQDAAIANQHFDGRLDNYRGRIASIQHFEQDVPQYTTATHYSYDIHGNVEALVQDITLFEPKKMTYQYDLISGNVHQVNYQPGEVDQFLQRYQYDADNRLITARSSRDGFVWDIEAEYYFYDHGPLARIELGEHKVQGLDYAYTIQGWVKGVNSATLNYKLDIGRDGAPGQPHANVARDATGYMLRYFTDDYKKIGGGAQWEPRYAGTGYHRQGRDLYNGNIQSMITAIAPMQGGQLKMPPQGYAYEYDQLNRITHAQVYKGLDVNANSWSVGANPIRDYESRYSFDADGNLQNLFRNGTTQGGNPQEMDDFEYHYYAGSNRLEYVDDGVRASNYDNDIDDQDAGNYRYDRIGNLTYDASEDMKITWNVSGKVKAMKTGAGKSLQMTYGAMGNRVTKLFEDNRSNTKEYTFYILDAAGNLMSTYTTDQNLSLKDEIKWQSAYVYGSGRIAEERIDTTMKELTNIRRLNNQEWYSLRERGSKYYELTEHRNNVLATLSDRKLAVDDDANGKVDWYEGDVWNVSDYYPYGMQMAQRQESATDTRFGFQGQEKDDELKGAGNSINYKYRVHDPRLGRFFAVDPLYAEYAYNSQYAFSENNVIASIEVEGLEKRSYVERSQLTTYGEISDFHSEGNKMFNSIVSSSWGLDQESYPAPYYQIFNMPEPKVIKKIDSEVKGFLRRDHNVEAKYQLPLKINKDVSLSVFLKEKTTRRHEISLSSVSGWGFKANQLIFKQEVGLELKIDGGTGGVPGQGWESAKIGLSTSTFNDFKFYGSVGNFTAYTQFSWNFKIERDLGYDYNSAYFIASPFQTEVGLTIKDDFSNSNTIGVGFNTRNIYSISRPSHNEIDLYNDIVDDFNFFYNSEVYKIFRHGFSPAPYDQAQEPVGGALKSAGTAGAVKN